MNPKKGNRELAWIENVTLRDIASALDSFDPTTHPAVTGQVTEEVTTEVERLIACRVQPCRRLQGGAECAKEISDFAPFALRR